MDQMSRAALVYSSKLNAKRDFLTMPHAEGRKSAEAFHHAHIDRIDERSTLDHNEWAACT